MRIRKGTLDHILSMQDDMIERELVLKGKFKQELDDLRHATELAEEKLGMVNTIEAAQQVKTDADEYASTLIADVNKKNADVDERIALITARENALAQQIEKFTVETDAAKTTYDNMIRVGEEETTRLNAMKERLQKRERDLVDQEKHTGESENTLRAREDAFNKKLDSLRIVAVNNGATD